MFRKCRGNFHQLIEVPAFIHVNNKTRIRPSFANRRYAFDRSVVVEFYLEQSEAGCRGCTRAHFFGFGLEANRKHGFYRLRRDTRQFPGCCARELCLKVPQRRIDGAACAARRQQFQQILSTRARSELLRNRIDLGEHRLLIFAEIINAQPLAATDQTVLFNLTDHIRKVVPGVARDAKRNQGHPVFEVH